MSRLFFLQGLLFIALSLVPTASFAARYLGIGPLDQLGDLKKKFPNAHFTRENPAWGQDHDALYTITGDGISGTIIINFYDSRPWWGKKSALEQDARKRELLDAIADGPDDNMTVSWVRWLPRVPFPLANLVAMYGKPEVRNYSREDFQPYREWKKRGIRAYLTDDGKKVVRINFSFTKKEREQAWQRKYGTGIPREVTVKEKTGEGKKIASR